MYAIAVIDNSMENDFNSLEKLVYQEKHLKEIFLQFNLRNISVGEKEMDVLSISIEMRLIVRTSKLWEGPRSYVCVSQTD